MRFTIFALLLSFAFPVYAQSLPDAPKPKPDRRIFIAGVALLAASEAADFESTASLVDRGGVENNRLLGRHPSPGKISAFAAVTFVGQSAIFYVTERNRHAWVRWTGRAFLGVSIVNHGQLAACNSKLDGRSTSPRSCSSFFGPL
jgi:hypothetical protein